MNPIFYYLSVVLYLVQPVNAQSYLKSIETKDEKGRVTESTKYSRFINLRKQLEVEKKNTYRYLEENKPELSASTIKKFFYENGANNLVRMEEENTVFYPKTEAQVTNLVIQYQKFSSGWLVKTVSRMSKNESKTYTDEYIYDAKDNLEKIETKNSKAELLQVTEFDSQKLTKTTIYSKPIQNGILKNVEVYFDKEMTLLKTLSTVYKDRESLDIECNIQPKAFLVCNSKRRFENSKPAYVMVKKIIKTYCIPQKNIQEAVWITTTDKVRFEWEDDSYVVEYDNQSKLNLQCQTETVSSKGKFISSKYGETVHLRTAEYTYEQEDLTK